MKIEICSIPYGMMVYWDNVKDAAKYFVHLLIGEKHSSKEGPGSVKTSFLREDTFQEIELVVLPKEVRHHSFINIPRIDYSNSGTTIVNFKQTQITYTGKDYYIYVEAQDKAGITIDRSNKEKGNVLFYWNGHYVL